MLLNIHFPTVAAIWLRQGRVFKQMMLSSLMTVLVNPLFFLFAFGFGLGAVVGEMGGMDYFIFVAAGMIAQGTMFASGFETAVNAFARMQTQRIYDAILATPATVREIAAAETLWGASKGTISGVGVLIITALFGGVATWWAVPAILPIIFLGGLAFAAFGLFYTSRAKGFDAFNFYFTLWITPNFLFTGVFFTLDRYPEWLQLAAQILPMTHLVNAIRTLTAGQAVDLLFWWHIGYLVLFSSIFFVLAFTKLDRRLIG
jgi:lipooligosaccharide transport system permease protein